MDLLVTAIRLFIQARRSNIEFLVSYPPLLDCAHLCVDMNKCSQVLRNLMSNALKFTPAGGTVKLVCKLESALGESLTGLNGAVVEDVIFRFEVHDTGPGISLVRFTCIPMVCHCLRGMYPSGKPKEIIR